MKRKIYSNIILALAAVALITLCISKCTSCKPDPDKPVVVTPEQIKTVYSPLYYELEKENKQLKRDKDSLQKINATLKKKIDDAKVAKNQAAVNVAVADKMKDTVALVVALKEEIAEAENVIQVQEEQLTIQSDIIKTNERIITNLETENGLQKQHINTLATSFQTQSGMLAQAEKNAEKNGKKVKRRGKIILGLIGVAVVEGIIISLQNR